MKQIETIEFPGQEYILDNIDYFKDKFVKDSVLAFRNANLTKKEQRDFHIKLGEKIGWYSIDSEKEGSYIENHSHNLDLSSSGPDDIMLFWHIEHVYLVNPIVAATWNMYRFVADENSGKTYFIDTSKIYEELSDDWKDFLQKCIANSGDKIIADDDDPVINECKEYSVVKDHWITGKKVIRIHLNRNEFELNKLSKYDNRVPSREEEEKFFEISKYINNRIIVDMAGLMFHKWQQGDLLIPDMFKLAHAVTGGFDPEDREFCGKWGMQH